MSYKNYIIKIKKITPILTEFQSDTVFGHLSWAVKYLYGDNKLSDFLNVSKTGEPPFICSNAFPQDYLPYPVLGVDLSDSAKDEINTIFDEEKVPLKNRKVVFKVLKDKSYIHKSLLNLYKNGINSLALTRGIFKGEICPKLMRPINNFDSAKKAGCAGFNKCVLFKDYKEDSNGKNSAGENNFENKCPAADEIKQIFAKKKDIWRNAINRISMTVEKGKLFSCGYDFYDKCAVLDLYIKISDFFSEDDIKKLFDYISKTGFGADASTGCGAFDFDIKEIPAADIKPDGSNAFISLSNYSPRPSDPADGDYKVFTKYPKISAALGHKNPFKAPVILIKPGAVFKLPQNNPANEFYGRMITGLAPVIKNDLDIDIVQCGLTYPYFIKLNYHNSKK